MDVFHLDYPIIMHLPILLDENQIIEKHHKKYEQIKIYKEFANYFVKLQNQKNNSNKHIFIDSLFCIFDICASGHSDDITLVVVVVVVYF